MEEEWIKEALKQPEAFERLYNFFYEPILRFVYRRVDSLEDAYDVTAQTFIQAYAHLPRYKPTAAPFKSWLYRIAWSQIGQFYRQKKKETTFRISDEQWQRVMGEAGEEPEDRWPLVELCMQDLNDAERQMLSLRFFDDCSFAEIAHVLEITEGNAKMRLYRVIDKLKGFLARHKVLGNKAKGSI